MIRPVIGLGCMRLSTEASRDDERAIAVIHAALDAGATVLDTADAYCRDEADVGHNERLVAEALRSWSGDGAAIQVATKGGLTRPAGRWIPKGRAKHLRAACEASLRALDVDVIDLYQLHVVDPKTPITTSVRALASLQREGMIREIGLCNVTVSQIEVAGTIADIAAVQVVVNPFDDTNLRNGVAEYCRDRNVRLIAYRPLGGERKTRLAKDSTLARIAARLDATPFEVALAWLRDLAPCVVPIPGATSEESARSLKRVLELDLTDTDRQILDERFPAGRLLRMPRDERRPLHDATGEVVVLMGTPAAGKTTIAQRFIEDGYNRLNRDVRGGRLADLIPDLDAGLSAGDRRWVLDNTYPSRHSRNRVIECAWEHGAPARCVWVTTSKGDAQVNAVTRMIGVLGHLPTPDELRTRSKDDPRFFGPDAHFRYERELEPPTVEEGFTSVDEQPFTRLDAGTGPRALIIEYDGVLCSSITGKSAVTDTDDVTIDNGNRDELRQHHSNGWRLLGIAWRPQLEVGDLTREQLDDGFARVRELLGIDIDLVYCPHKAGPPVCWCRKPLPGLVLEWAIEHGVRLDGSILVGRGAADMTLARTLGVEYREGSEFLQGRNATHP